MYRGCTADLPRPAWDRAVDRTSTVRAVVWWCWEPAVRGDGLMYRGLLVTEVLDCTFKVITVRVATSLNLCARAALQCGFGLQGPRACNLSACSGVQF
jgi:hypothetical protein